LKSLTVHAGDLTYVTVNDTLPNIVTTIDAPLRTTGSTGVNVSATTGPLVLGLFGPQDYVTLGSSANTLDTIQAAVTIGGGNPAASLNEFTVTVHDFASAEQQTFTLTADGLTRANAAPISFTSRVYGLSLGIRPDEVDVQGTPGATFLFPNQEDYTVNIGT